MTGWLYSLDPEDPVAAMREFGLRSQVSFPFDQDNTILMLIVDHVAHPFGCGVHVGAVLNLHIAAGANRWDSTG